MKTEEDEAFDDLARRQGMWGGGFTAKRQMAADKQEPWNEDEWRRNNWRCSHGWLRGEQCEICNAAQPAQEPVAWITPDREGFRIRFSEPTNDVPLGWDPLYTTPPKRTWVGLTDEEREGIAQDYSLTGLGYQSPFKAIEAMLKEKNT